MSYLTLNNNIDNIVQRTCLEFLVCQKMAVWWLHSRQLALASFAASMGPTQQIQISQVDINPPEGVLAVFFAQPLNPVI